MKLEACDRCYYTKEGPGRLTEAYKILQLKQGTITVRGALCQPHYKEANANTAFYDRKAKRVGLKAFEDWLLGRDLKRALKRAAEAEISGYRSVVMGSAQEVGV